VWSVSHNNKNDLFTSPAAAAAAGLMSLLASFTAIFALHKPTVPLPEKTRRTKRGKQYLRIAQEDDGENAEC
jgi:hypothetical protein